MLPEDIYELVNAGDPRISPDGSRVAFVVTAVDREANEYRGAIWVAPLDGSAEPRQFTAGERRDTTPRWSPDGNWLAFASNRRRRQDAHEPLRHSGGGRRGAQADRPEGERRGDRLVARTRSASPSARACATKPTRRRTTRSGRRGGSRASSTSSTASASPATGASTSSSSTSRAASRQLTSGDFEDGSPAWSPDGKRIVFDGLRDERWDTELITRLYVVDADGGEPVQLTGDEGSYETPAFSPTAPGSRTASPSRTARIRITRRSAS